MSNVNNLHSLLGGKWMITDQFANSLAPYVINILKKGEFPNNEGDTPVHIGYVGSNGIFEEETKDNDEKYVAVLSIKGPILKYSQFCGPTGTKSMMRTMEQWSKDPSVIGVLLDIDSGGGQVSGTGEFAEYLNSYNKPVVSYTDGMICSAAFYIASGTREIFANKHADCIGSIGTMIKYLDLDGAYQKLGAKVIEAYASKSTHKNNAFRKAKEGDLSPMIKEELDPINEIFHNNVLAFRPNVKKENLNGHHTSDLNQALELGLIDTIGDKQAAIDRIFELANENTNTKKESDMSGENTNYGSIAAVIGTEELTASKKILTGKTGVFLTVAQLGLLDAKLEGNADVVQGLKDASAKSTKTINDLTANKTAITAAIDGALEVAGLEAGESPEASITSLGAKVAEYGAQPGAKGTTVTSKGDRTDEEPESTAIMDSINV